MIYDLQSIGEAASMFNPFGIRLDGGTNTKIYYNSINMTGTFTGTGAIRSAALLVNSTSLTGLDVRNNIFANSMTGTATTTSYAVYALSGVTFGTINYNDYFVSGANGILGFLGADKTTLADWKTATTQDVNSVNANPQFTSSTDLHISASNTALNNAGTPIAGITTDFDGDTRSTTTPEIGADEIATVVAAPTVTAGGPTTFCTGGSVVLTAASTATGATFTWQLNGVIIPGATNATYTATTSGSYTAVASVGGASTPIVVTVNTPAATPTITAGGPTTICAGSSVVLTAASTTTGATYAWFTMVRLLPAQLWQPYTANAAGNYTVVAIEWWLSFGCFYHDCGNGKCRCSYPNDHGRRCHNDLCRYNGNVNGRFTTTGATYAWFNNGTAITGAISATYAANAAGAYTAVATAGGCPSAASTATPVIVTPLPATPTITQTGGTLTSSSATGNQWFLNGWLYRGQLAELRNDCQRKLHRSSNG